MRLMSICVGGVDLNSEIQESLYYVCMVGRTRER